MVSLLMVSLYVLCMVVFCLFGIHRLWHLWTYFRIKYKDKKKLLSHQESNAISSALTLNSGRNFDLSEELTVATITTPPCVTIQLPIYNEKYVVERLVNAVCAIDYPRDRLEIQVLDDSTDETIEKVDELVQEKQAEGFDIQAIRRPHRQGFKAGALQYGLNQCRGEFVLIFDADFIPPANLLKEGMPHFSQPSIGMVQFPWGHVNRDYSLLTHAQAVLLDGHFKIEHLVRSRTGCFFNFNGTAGIWRKQCILDAGGWQGDTLTEDMDLSYRAQMKGWVFHYVPDVRVPAELPIELNAFKSQQYRWAKGGVQTAIKLLPKLLKSPLPFKVKLEAIFHLTANLTYIFIPILILLLPSLILCMSCIPPIVYTSSFVAAVFSVILFYAIAQSDESSDGLWKKVWERIVMIPVLMAVGSGLCVNNSKAVLEAIFKCQSGFIRTPKYNIFSKSDALRDRKSYRVGSNIYFFFELFLFVYLISVAVIGWTHHAYHVMPFILIFMSGFFYFTVLTIRQSSIIR